MGHSPSAVEVGAGIVLAALAMVTAMFVGIDFGWSEFAVKLSMLLTGLAVALVTLLMIQFAATRTTRWRAPCWRGWTSNTGGTWAPGTVALLESALEHQGRLRPAQYEAADALTWPVLAVVHRRLGEPKQEVEARVSAEARLDDAPARVGALARRALALLD